jgi:diguanylate cyclase (GGDEF)-like protein
VNELLARLRAQLRRVSRHSELLRESLLDPLTHVLNRRGFDELFQSHSALLRRRPGVLSLLMIDLDEFKAINDQHGHVAGDAVLVEVSSVLSRAVRASDRVGRMGGDEFAILLPEANPAVARALAERLRALSPIRVKVSGELEVPASFSLGAATANAVEPLALLLARADLAMYGDKRRRARARQAS